MPRKAGDNALNRSEFCPALKEVFAEYLKELRDPESVEFAHVSAHKMNHVAKEA